MSNAVLQEPTPAEPGVRAQPSPQAKVDSRTADDSHRRFRQVLLWSVWIGMIAGGIEGVSWTLYQQRTGGMVFMHPGYLWMSSACLGFLCLLAGAVPAFYGRRNNSAWSFDAAVTISSLVAWLNMIQLFVPGLQEWAWLLLGGGLATVTSRWVKTRWNTVQRSLLWSVPGIALMLMALAAGRPPTASPNRPQLTGNVPPAASSKIAQRTEELPNILLIVLDTVRADAVHSKSGLTPNIARHAARGTEFTAAKSTAPWTLPSQTGMFTGRLPHELSTDWWSRLDDTYPTLAEILSRHGWNTGGFVANTRYCSAETGLGRGFRHYEDYRLSWADFLLTTALGRKVLMSPLPTYVGICDFPGRKHASEINDSFLAWLEKSPNVPFFAFLNYWDAHDPYMAAPQFQSQPRPRGEDLMLLRDWWWTHKDDVTSQQVAMLRTAYEDCIRGLDDQVGQLLDTLEKRGVLEETLVIITSDHGEHFGDHNIYLHGNSLYDAALAVPLKVIFPGRVDAGRECNVPVSLRGLSNTVLELVGLSAGQSAEQSAELAADLLPGRSWTPHLTATSDQVAAWPIISEIASQAGFPPCHGRSPVAAGPMQCVQWGDWKYLRNGLGEEQLFNLREDPLEAKNLMDSVHSAPAIRTQLEKLRQALREENPDGKLSPWLEVPSLEREQTTPNRAEISSGQSSGSDEG